MSSADEDAELARALEASLFSAKVDEARLAREEQRIEEALALSLGEGDGEIPEPPNKTATSELRVGAAEFVPPPQLQPPPAPGSGDVDVGGVSSTDTMTVEALEAICAVAGTDLESALAVATGAVRAEVSSAPSSPATRVRQHKAQRWKSDAEATMHAVLERNRRVTQPEASARSQDEEFPALGSGPGSGSSSQRSTPTAGPTAGPTAARWGSDREQAALTALAALFPDRCVALSVFMSSAPADPREKASQN